MQVVDLKPAAALDIFESVLLQDQDLPATQPLRRRLTPDCAKDAATVVACLDLFGDKKIVPEGEDAEPEVPEPGEYTFFEPEDPEEGLRLLSPCGAGVPKLEVTQILLTMKQLGGSDDYKVEALRFFGKFYTLKGQYYVFECRMMERPEKEEVEEPELAPGEAPAEADTGCNKYMYYACTNLGGPLTLLDDVTPDQIKAARRIHKLLTGDLDSVVGGFPAFPGRERHYLRAQVSRIAHATTLCPKGLYTMPEEAEEPEANEEYTALSAALMRDPASWCHWAPHIKAMGVTVLPEVPEPDDEDNPPVLLPEQTETGPRLLTPASHDVPAAAAPAAWAPFTSSCSRTVQHQVAGVRSVLWPGAHAVSDGKTWANVYVGWGVKRGAGSAAVAACVMQADPVLPTERTELPPPPAKEDAEEEEEEE
eukprot:jgi/Ulvmu1/10794/UM069_0028.1